jgi:outer membrane protein assembly factor BamD
MLRGTLLALALVFAVAGCATKKKLVPPDKLWAEGNEAFQNEAWEIAVERYKALLDQHPFDPNAEEAELKIGQAHYLAGRYAEAIAAFSDFERMHPTSQNLAFVEYHLGMAYLAQRTTSDRDQQAVANAHTYFRNLIDRFPTSPWAEKARLRERECREIMAAHDASIAEYYLRHKNLKAAESRLRGLLTEYPETEPTAQTLSTFAATYAENDDRESATLALATIVHYHPEGPLAADARKRLGAEDGSLGGQDPLPLLVRHLDELQGRADRQNLPPAISAYPDSAGGQQRY